MEDIQATIGMVINPETNMTLTLNEEGFEIEWDGPTLGSHAFMATKYLQEDLTLLLARAKDRIAEAMESDVEEHE